MLSKPPFCTLTFISLLVMEILGRPANHSALKGNEEQELLPPDHLNGVKMELDGHLNRDFHHEVFLGKDRDEFEEDSEPRRNRRKLMVIFEKVDTNKDKQISAKEMQRWILEKTDEHFQEAVQENKIHFRAVDPDGDGKNHIFYLQKNHFLNQFWEEIIKFRLGEVLDNLKDRWYQADNPPPDLLLSEQEFLSFLHPEHSRGMLHFMVQEIIRDLDQDGDKKLTVSEFISLPVGTVENQQGQDIDDDWVRDRRREFQDVIDANRDGIVTMEELEEYMDPMNEHNALNEARQMIAVADENQNHHLELEEILKYSEYFTGSKLMDYARNVHEEF
uniref:45 kDa calcium-binding protein n=1 Tax=Zosterops lateralis melanops TaxID=1220523 RepID=A0A8D2PRG8_ZOSLA